MSNIEPGSLDYKILLQFLFQDGGIRPGELKNALHTSHSTINSALKRLEEQGYVQWELYGNVNLLEKGEMMLTHIETHHHLIEVFLVDSLDLTPNHAHKEALHLASHFSCETIKKICEKYRHPKICPNNRPIPHYKPCHKHDGEELTYLNENIEENTN